MITYLWEATIKVKTAKKLSSPSLTAGPFEIDLDVLEPVDVNTPHFSVRGERINFRHGFSISYGQLQTFEKVELAEMSPSDIEFHLYSHLCGRSTFENLDYAPIVYDNGPDATLFRPREHKAGMATVDANQTIDCFELHFSIPTVIEWFEKDPPKPLRPLLKSSLRAGLGMPLPVLDPFHSMQRLITKQPFIGPLKKLAVEGMSLQMASIYLALIGDEKTSDWPGLMSKEEKLATQARELLLEDLQSPPAVSELARLLNISPRRLNVVFKEVFGQSIFQTLTSARLENARLLLMGGNMPIKQIAYSAGYRHVSNFSSAFKSRFGVAPSHFTPMTFKEANSSSEKHLTDE